MTVDLEDGFTEEITEPCPEGIGISIDDFVAYLPTGVYIFTPCRETWIGRSVNARLPPVPVLNKQGNPKRVKGKLVTISATRWLDQNKAVLQMTWAPGLPMLIGDRLVSHGGWLKRKEVTCFNLYRPPLIKLGDAGKAKPWLDHAHKVFNADEVAHCLKWLAHRVQRPGEKINHGLVWGGEQGIGKDSLLEPVKHAVGPWNFHDTSPTHLLGRFNSFAKSVILRVNEGRDLGEVDRFKFYDHTKIYTAAPPDVLRVDEKYLREHYVFNVLGFIVTTNHKTDGIFLPADDRRHYVCWSDRRKEDFSPGYWTRLWDYYADGGLEHVAAYLMEFDLSDFDPKAPPPRTPAFWDIVNVGRAPEDSELADLLDGLSNPDVVTLVELTTKANGGIAEWLLDRKNRRALPHRLERCGYVSVRNPHAKDGLWKLRGARQVIYARTSLTPQQREAEAQRMYQSGR
jgi:Family of unknown function (DUF5906)